MLKDTITSVAQQHYAKWELIVACEPSQAQAIRDLPEAFGMEEKQTLHVLKVEKHSFESLLLGAAHSSGEFVWFVKCGDLLARHALTSIVYVLNESLDTDLFYCDEDQSLLDGSDPIPFLKPSWSPELLLSTNYLSYATVFRRTLLSDSILANEGKHKLSLYDCLLWASEKTTNITHLSRVLYHSRGASNSPVARVASPSECSSAEKPALERALQRRGIEGKVEETVTGHFRIRYRLDQPPLVSILIPTKDRISLLSRCVASIEERTTYASYEILILDNGSVSGDAKKYFSEIAKKWRVLSCPGSFNFSAINNHGAAEAKGEYLLFLNDDTEVMTPDWLTIMMEQASRPGIGAVGAKLLYPNGRIQHAGVVLGVGGVAGHAFRHIPDQEWGYHGLAHLTRNCSAVTAACMLVSRTLFRQIRGFDPNLPVEYNDVDLCLRIRREGQRIVYAPEAVLYHYESATRKGTRCRADEERIQQIWGESIREGDPYYNVNLTTDREDWSLRL
jgi:GT2 family glycosyltransferase